MRYLPLSDADRIEMLDTIGVDSVDDLYSDVPGAFLNHPIDLPAHQSEMAVERHLTKLAAKNIPAGSVPFFVGAGAYKHHVPATVDHMIQRGEFLTAYTPYQPEIAQGTLQYIFEFQSQVAAMTGMDVANASLYDGSTACGEAVLMARRVTRKKKALLSGNLHPHYRSVVQTMTRFTDDEVAVADASAADSQAALDDLSDQIDDATSCVVVQNPDVYGNVLDVAGVAEKAHAHKALLIVVVTEAVSLGLLKTPGDMGADIVVGEGQSIGNGLNYGGPYLGLFATKQKYVRQMPGRLCGETVDANGKRGFVLTLSTREQHIRREKATSNICTNSGLCALAFTIHMSLLGGKGLREMAARCHAQTVKLATALQAIDGISLLTATYFNEITVSLPVDANGVVEALAGQHILAGVPASRLDPSQDNKQLILAATEMTTDEDIADLVAALKEQLS